ncbi:MAG: TonB-dependent receptor, partial [Candidatus Cloacimonadales bacterium]
GFETENKVGTHVINSSFIVSPQAHNQARSTYDRELGKFLGREFNFTNHPWQENTYVKPQLCFRDKWTISPQTNVMTNLFITTGKGGGSYANNIIFDAESGALLYQPLNSVDVERRNFARHAYKIYQETGYLIEGMEIIDHGAYQEGQFTWEGETETVYSGSDFYTNQHTWKYKSYNNHQQFGLNSYFDHEFNDYFNLVLGAESRYWKADHYKEGSDFRYYQPSDPDSVSTLGAFVRDYDYTTDVLNTSGFVRSKIEIPFDSYIQNINLMLDGQYAVYYSEVNENLLQYYDFMKDEFIGEGFYATKNDSILVWQHDAAGDSTQVLASKFSADDYTRTFDFFSPKMGINVNLDDNWNVLANYSIVYKEPRVGDWYDRSEGPGVNQVVDGKAFELNPEKGETFEVGAGYRNDIFKSDITYYHTKFTDKIENITDQHGDSKTINAGNATHRGIEISLGGKYNNFDANSSATFSRNRWGDLNLQNIFYESAEDVEGKVVPYSPEQMASASLGYTFQDMPLMGSLRLGLSGKWSDEYYSTYDNVYVKQEYYDEAGNFQSIGEHDFVANAEGEGAYDYDAATETYIKNFSGTGEYDREWIYSSSKLPTFFELNGSISYKFYLGSHETSIKLNINNILNKEDNYSKAYITRAYGMKLRREDEDGNVSWDDPTFGEGATGGNSTGGGYYPYLSPAPLLNLFLTMEIKF